MLWPDKLEYKLLVDVHSPSVDHIFVNLLCIFEEMHSKCNDGV